MRWPRIDVYEFIRWHDVLNFRLDDEITEFNNTKNNPDDFGECREVKEIYNKRKKFDGSRGCNGCGEARDSNDCLEFCNEGRNDFDAIKAIWEALRDIQEALLDVEKNRIREGIRDIMEGIMEIREGVDNLVKALSQIHE